MDEELSQKVAIRICGAAERMFTKFGWKLTLSYGFVSQIGSQKSLDELIQLARENKLTGNHLMA
jgi:hypothetical protein